MLSRVFCKNTLSQDEHDFFEHLFLLPIIFTCFSFVLAPGRERKNIGNNSTMDISKRVMKTLHPQKELLTPCWKVRTDKKLPSLKVQKRPTERQLCLCQMPEELKAYVFEHPEIRRVFIEPAVGERYSESRYCYKLEIKIHIKLFNLLEFVYMKQPPVEHSVKKLPVGCF